MIPDAVSSYEEKQEELALLERLTEQARLLLMREGSRIRAPAVVASAEGVLISEILGIFLFLFLVGGMLLFFQKETNFASGWRHGLWRGTHRLIRGVRRRVFRFDREWSCDEEATDSADASGPGVYRGMTEDDIAVASLPPPSETFNHRQALLELFADLELQHEVVRHSLHGYGTASALSRLDGQAAPPARPDSVKVVPLPGILCVPAAALGGCGRHRHGHHHHHHHHHRHRRCEAITEKRETDEQNGGVTAKTSDDVTVHHNGDDVTLEVGGDVKHGRTAVDIEVTNSVRSCGENSKGEECECIPRESNDIVVLQNRGASLSKSSAETSL